MGPMGRAALGRCQMGALCALLAGLCFLLLAPKPAFAAEAHVFDAELSLVGGCVKSPADSVADPGCPGGVHPLTTFTAPTDVATDEYGNIFVASQGHATNEDGRVDVFDSAGLFIVEVAVPTGPTSIVVDATGHLYAYNLDQELLRYDSSTYE